MRGIALLNPDRSSVQTEGGRFADIKCVYNRINDMLFPTLSIDIQ